MYVKIHGYKICYCVKHNTLCYIPLPAHLALAHIRICTKRRLKLVLLVYVSV